MRLSDTLREAILSSKKSRYAIAVGSGVDHAVLRRFVTRERDIKLDTADRLAEFLGLELTRRRSGGAAKPAKGRRAGVKNGPAKGQGGRGHGKGG